VRLKKIQLINFKNYPSVEVDFSSKINVLVGKNGSGKTNLLDAVYYLSFTKSAFNSSDNLAIRRGQDHFFIRGNFQLNEKFHDLSCGVQPGIKKAFAEDGREYQKLSDHIGKYPAVLVAPDDIDLIKEGGDARRKFFDSIISQIDRTYLEDLIHYNHCLRQRNGLLRMFHDRGKPDWIALEMYDEVLVPLGISIFKKRYQFVNEFLPVFSGFYNFLVGEEPASLYYSSGLAEVEFKNALLQNRQKDVALSRTCFGPHRDDYNFTLGGEDLKKLGSQGQKKSFVISLKFSQWDVIWKHKGFQPVLLMDDIFDKLDDFRIGRLLELIKSNFGQIFITDARPDRTQGLLSQVGLKASVFEISNGNVLKENEKREG
jgi:DNA replication and repair protein RecF